MRFRTIVVLVASSAALLAVDLAARDLPDPVQRQHLCRRGWNAGRLLGVQGSGDVLTVSDDCDTNRTGTISNLRIQAAILALNHSFVVDNWSCGTPTGDLSVDGAIAQKFRGPVGTGSGGSISTGYRKDYEYNDRLRYREPPYFLDPVQASWRIARQHEQSPAQR